MDRERLKRIRNFQSKDWYAAVFIRPLTILVMLVIADWRWLTPNRLTHMANLAKLGAAACIFLDTSGSIIAGVILLQLGCLGDHLDGTMARYRRHWSGFGSFYDKSSDAVTWFVIMLSVGWLAYQRSGDAHLIVLATVAAYASLVIGYFKWVAHAEVSRLDWHRAKDEPDRIIAANTRPPRPSEPPARTRKDWILWYLWRWAQIVRFDEMDLFFWVSLGLLIDQLALLLWVLAITQTLGVAIMAIKRGLEVRRVDVLMAPYRARAIERENRAASLAGKETS